MHPPKQAALEEPTSKEHFGAAWAPCPSPGPAVSSASLQLSGSSGSPQQPFPFFRGALLKLQPSQGARQRCASKFRDSTSSRGCFRGGEKSFLQAACSNVALKMNTQIKITLRTQSIPRQ